MLDVNRIKDDINAIDVIKHLGVHYMYRGGKYFIHCPGHKNRLGKEDEHLGNCVVTEKGYYCFACGKSVNTCDMIMELTGCDFKGSLEVMLNVLGGDYEIDNVFIPLLSQDERKALGLKSFYDTKDGIISITEIEKKNKTCFKLKIKELTKNKLESLKKVLSDVEQDEQLNKIKALRGSKYSYQDVTDVRNYLSQKMEILNTILTKCQ